MKPTASTATATPALMRGGVTQNTEAKNKFEKSDPQLM